MFQRLLHSASATAAALLALPTLASLVSGCATVAPVKPDMGLAAEAVRKSPDAATPRQLALAGFHAWLDEGDASKAEGLWDKALAASAPKDGASGKSGEAAQAKDPLALYGKLEAARRRLDVPATASLALDICEEAPAHALCLLSVPVIDNATADTPVRDEAMLRRIKGVIQSGKASPSALRRLRDVEATIELAGGDYQGFAATFRDAGYLDHAWLAGPFSRFSALDWDKPFWPEEGALAGEGLRGPVQLREMVVPSAKLSIEGDPSGEHVYYWIADIQVDEGADYLASVTGGAVKVFVDGVLVLDRRGFDGFIPGKTGAQVSIPAGRHRVVVKVPRLNDGPEAMVGFSRLDGAPAGFRILKPEGRVGAGDIRVSEASPADFTVESAAAALAPEVGDRLATYIAARSVGHDRLGRRQAAESLCPDKCSAQLLSLRGDARKGDPTLPENVSGALSLSDREAAVTLDAYDAASIAVLMENAMGKRRVDKAQAFLEQLKKALPEGAYGLVAVQLAMADQRGLDSETEAAAERLLSVDPGNCMAARKLLDLASRQDAAGKQDEALEKLEKCAASTAFLRAVHYKSKGLYDKSREALLQLTGTREVSPALQRFLVDLAISKGDLDEALRLADQFLGTWPRNARAVKLKADILERRGDAEGALALRRHALEVSGDDLELRQAVSIATGEKILSGALEDGLEWIQRYKKASPLEDAPSTVVLDSYVASVELDGSLVAITQSVSRANDQDGARSIAEVQIPSDANVLVLRTIKEDGTILEAEPIGGKSSTSMPNVEEGDYVEVAYLTARGPSSGFAPAFISPYFRFRSRESRFFHSTFQIRAPEGTDLVLDRQNVPDGAIVDQVKDGVRTITVAFDDVPPFTQEPNGIPVNENIPWVVVGSRGLDDAMHLSRLADSLWTRSWRSPAIDALAAELVQGKTGREAVEAIYDGVMKRVEGDESAGKSASETLAEGRGSRLNLTKALLDASGFTTRLVALRSDSLSTWQNTLPAFDLWKTVVLSVDLPEGEVILFPALRWAPFGSVPPYMVGARAAVLPSGGWEGAVRFFTLPVTGRTMDRKTVSLSLELSADGTLRGQGETVFDGFQGSALRPALEKMGRGRISQLVERAIVGELFKGARLLSHSVNTDDAHPETVAFRYEFEVPRFARVSGDELVVDKGIAPQDLAGDWLKLFVRETPLEVSVPLSYQLSVNLAMPEGYSLKSQEDELKLESKFGTCHRVQKVSGQTVTLDESFLLNRQRVSPEEYPAFGEMITTVDRAETAPWKFGKSNAVKAASAPAAGTDSTAGKE